LIIYIYLKRQIQQISNCTISAIIVSFCVLGVAEDMNSKAFSLDRVLIDWFAEVYDLFGEKSPTHIGSNRVS